MKTVLASMRTHLDGTVTSIATIWKLERQDGVAYYFTDHDVDISFDDGSGLAVYKAEGGYDRTAIANNVGLAVDNVDVEGFMDSQGLPAKEVKAGLFDYAEILVSIVNWADLADGSIILRRGHIGEVQTSHTGLYSAELRGLASDLSQTIVGQYQAECHVDLGSTECGIPLNPDVLARSTAVSLGQVFKVVTKSTTGISWANILANPDFEHNQAAMATSVNAWTVTSGEWDITETVDGLAPHAGTVFLRAGTSASGEISQKILLTTFGLDLTALDAGNVSASFSGYRANTDVDDTGRILVQFLDASDAVTGTLYDSTTEAILPVDTWVNRAVSGVAVPANTRAVKITLSYTLVTGGQCDSCFDDMGITLSDSATTNTFQEIYENRIYTVTTAGTTAGAQPVYDTTVGNTTTDGTAVLTASESWTRDASISDVLDFSSMKAIVSDVMASAGWFSGGGMAYESGDNKGVIQEVKNWDGSAGLSLFLPPVFTVYPGTKVSIYPGCDKRVSICLSKFSNVINHRGQPFVPGQDLLTQLSSTI